MANDVQTNIRLPADLKQKISEAAESNGRSFTAELVHRLRRYDEVDAAGLEALVKVAVQKMDDLQQLVDSLDLHARKKK
ncbi:TPA: Arc family DNA-binding protein [Stenotrophomonas maltophilia]